MRYDSTNASAPASHRLAPAKREIHISEIIRRWQMVLLVTPAFLTVLILLIIPLGRMLFYSFFDPTFTLAHYLHIFNKPVYIKVMLNTIKISAIVTLFCLIIGYACAYYLSQMAGPKIKNIALAIIISAFLVSFLAKMFVWMIVLQKNGIVNQILIQIGVTEKPLKMLYELPSVIIAMVQILLPYMILPIYSVTSGINPHFIQAAKTLGANRFQAFIKIFLPLSVPGIGAGCIQVFILALGYFIIPALLGGRKETMISQLIDMQVNRFGNWGFGSALSIVLLAIVMLLFGLYSKYFGLEHMIRAGGRG